MGKDRGIGRWGLRLAGAALCLCLAVGVFFPARGEGGTALATSGGEGDAPASPSGASGASGGEGALSTPEIDEAEERREEMEERKRETEERIASLEKEKGDILAYIEKLDNELSRIQGEIGKLEEKKEIVARKLSQTEEDLSEARAQEERQYLSMRRRVKYIYENGTADYLSLLFGAKDFGDFLNRAEYVAKISAYDKKCYEDYKELRRQVIEKQEQLSRRMDELGDLEEELDYEESTVRKLTEDKAEQLQDFEEQIALEDSKAQEYEEEIERQEQQIEELLEERRRQIEEEERRRREEEERRQKEEEERRRREEEARQQAENSGAGGGAGAGMGGSDQGAGESGQGSGDGQTGSGSGQGLSWPLNTSGTITSYFGSRSQPTAGASTDHKGIDIGAPSGTSILAAGSGTVVTASYSSSSGNYVMIYHGNNLYTVYMHCSSISVSEGQAVSQGQAIGTVGSTGISTGPHLHFGVSVNGAYVDPLGYVSP